MGTSAAALETAEKKGLATGLSVKHPFNGKSYPVYIANFVLMDYGTGAIFGCPAHDQRDFDFATKYGLPIKAVFVAEESPQGLDERLVQPSRRTERNASPNLSTFNSPIP